MNPSRVVGRTIALCAGFSFSSVAAADTFRWTGVPEGFGSLSANDVENWLNLTSGITNATPGVLDDVFFNDLGANGVVTVVAPDTPLAWRNLTVEDGEYRFSFSSSTPVRVSDRIQVGTTTNLARLEGAFDLGTTGVLDIGVADQSNAAFRGNVVGDRINVGIGSGSVAEFESTSRLTVNQLNLGLGENSLVSAFVGGGSEIGTVTVAPGLHSIASLELNSATVGTLTLASTGAEVRARDLSYETIINDSGGTFIWDGGRLESLLAQDFTFANGALLGASFVQDDASMRLVVNGDVVIDGADASYTLQGGTLTAKNIQRVNGGAFAYEGGVIELTNSGIAIEAGGLFGEQFVSQAGRQTFSGTASINGPAASLTIDGGTFTAEALTRSGGGTFSFQSGSFTLLNDGFSIGNGGDQGALAVARTEIISGSSFTSFTDNFSVSGDVDILDNGILTIDRGSFSAGSLNIAPGGVFAYNGGTFVLTNDGMTVGDAGDLHTLDVVLRVRTQEDRTFTTRDSFTVSGNLDVVDNGVLTIGRGQLNANALNVTGNGSVVSDGAAMVDFNDIFSEPSFGSVGTTQLASLSLADQASMQHIGGQITVAGALALSGDAVFTQSVNITGDQLNQEERTSGLRAGSLSIQDNARLELLDRYAYLQADQINVTGNGVLDFQQGTLRTRDLAVGGGGVLGNSVTLGGDQNLDLQDSALTIEPGATFTLDGGIVTASSFNNDGTFDFRRGYLIYNDATFSVAPDGLLGDQVTLGSNAGGLVDPDDPSNIFLPAQTIGDQSRFSTTTDVALADNASLTLESRGALFARDVNIGPDALLTVNGGRFEAQTITGTTEGSLALRSGSVRLDQLDVGSGTLIGTDLTSQFEERLFLAANRTVIADGSINLSSNNAETQSNDHFFSLGRVDLQPGGALNVSGGTFRVSKIEFNGGDFNWTGGRLSLFGRLDIGGQGDIGADITLADGMTLDVNSVDVGESRSRATAAPGFQNAPDAHTSHTAESFFTRRASTNFGFEEDGGNIVIAGDGTLTVDGGAIDAHSVRVAGRFDHNSGTTALRDNELFSPFDDLVEESAIIVENGGEANLRGGTIDTSEIQVRDGGSLSISGATVNLANDLAPLLSSDGVSFTSGKLTGTRAAFNAGDRYTLRAGAEIDVDGAARRVTIEGGTLRAVSVTNAEFERGQVFASTASFDESLTVDSGDVIELTGTFAMATGEIAELDGGRILAGAASDPTAIRFSAGDLEFTQPSASWATSAGTGASVDIRNNDHFVNAGETTVAAGDTLSVDIGGIFSTEVLRLQSGSEFFGDHSGVSIGNLINDGGAFTSAFLAGDLFVSSGITNITSVGGNVEVSGGSANIGTVSGDLTLDGGDAMIDRVNGSVTQIGVSTTYGTIGLSLTLQGGASATGQSVGGMLTVLNSDGEFDSVNQLHLDGGSISVDQVGLFGASITRGTADIGTVLGNVSVLGGEAQFDSVDGNLRIDGGLVQALAVGGEVVNTGDGVFSPGASPALTVVDEFTQTSGATLIIEIGGLTPELEHDVFRVNGAVSLGGKLQLVAVDGFRTPDERADLMIFDFAGFNGDPSMLTGTFDEIEIVGFYADTTSLLTNGTITVPSPGAAFLLCSFAGASLVRRRR